MGHTILDLFRQSLDWKSPDGAAILDDSKLAVIRRMYDLQDGKFCSTTQLSIEFDLSGDQIRHICMKSLSKIGNAVRKYPDQIAAAKILPIIEQYAHKTGNEGRIESAIVSLWYYEMREIPYRWAIRMLACLYYKSIRDVRIVVNHEIVWRKHQKGLAKLERMNTSIATRAAALNSRLNSLLENVIWPKQVKIWQPEEVKQLFPVRVVNHNSLYKSGIFKSSKCNRDIQYESAAELNFIKFLENCPNVVHYLEQPLRIEYRRWEKDRRYTPDFLILLNNGRVVIAELKDFVEMTHACLHRRMEALMPFCEDNGLGILITNGRETIQTLINDPYDSRFERELQRLMKEYNNEMITYSDFRGLIKEYQIRMRQFLAIVLNNNWNLYTKPIRLTGKNLYPDFRKVIHSFKKNNMINE